MLNSKTCRCLLSLFLVLAMVGSFFVPAVSAQTPLHGRESERFIQNELPAEPNPAAAEAGPADGLNQMIPSGDYRGVNNRIVIDDNAEGGYEGDYVVIYNPATSSSTSYSTGTMTGLIETSITPNIVPQRASNIEKPLYKIDVDAQLEALAQTAPATQREPEPTRASYNVGDTKTFSILSQYSPTGSGSVQFKCLYVGQHCYIWTPTSSSNNTYPLDTIDSSFAQMAAAEFDSKFDLMQSSFGNHTNGSSGDGKLHMLYYNINDGWEPGQGYVAGFFYQVDITNNGLPILNIDTYPGVYYMNSSGTEYKRMDDTYNTMVHEYQHLINYANTSNMGTWLNEGFSAAAEEICDPGGSVVGRIQSWEGYYYSDNNDWLNPPAEFQYQSSNSLHTGYSMYAWSNNLDNTSLLTLYSQVSFFAQYLYTRFGNTIYKQISNKYSSSEVSAITSATGVSCADLVRDFRVAVTANAAQNQYNGVYGFKAQEGYDPANYNNVQNPWDLLSPVVFTGSSCSIKGGGAITVKPVGGVYNPPSGANSNLKYIGIKVNNYEITAISNNEAWGTVSVNGSVITASPVAGYYVESCDVISGTATCTINGNTISVSASEDCTIRVNFAPKPLYTVSFVASGNAEGSQTAYVNDAITLPASVGVTAAGWTFSGWMDHQIDETSEAPSYYAPGASYTVTGNTTLYAVYTRVEAGTGEVIYRLADGPTDGGKYILVAHGAISGTAGYAVGNTIVSSSHYLTPVSVTINGELCAASAANLPKVLWEASAASNGYSFYNEAVGKYMGLDAGEYLYPSGTALAWAYTEEGYLDNQIDSEGYYYLSYSSGTSARYTTSKTGAKINLYQEVNDSTSYYTTDPVEPAVEERPVTVYIVDELDGNALNAWIWNKDTGDELYENWPGEALTAEGNDKGGHPWYMLEIDLAAYNTMILNRSGQPQSGDLDLISDAGEKDYIVYYIYGVDGNLQISTGTDVWPAPGAVTAASCTEGGYTTYTGLLTGEERIENETDPLGHDFTVPVAEVPATCTAGGYTTYKCSRCDVTETRDQTDALGHLPGEPVQENYVEPTATTEGGYDTVVYCQRCSTQLERVHTVLPAVPLGIYPSVSIGIELFTTFGVRKAQVDAFDHWYIEVSKLDAAGNPTETKRFGEGQDGAVQDLDVAYNAVYTDITAKEMGVTYTATVHAFTAENVEYCSETVKYTLRDYILEELLKEENPDEMRKLCADLLNYGAAAQVYFEFDKDNLVNENLSDEAQAAMNRFATTGEAPAALVNNANSGTIFTSVSVMNRVVLSLAIRGFGDAGAVQIEIRNHDSGAVKEVIDAEKLGSIWRAKYSDFEAYDMRKAFDFTVLADGAAAGTPITWSVEGYVREGRLNEDSSPEELALLNALLHYVDAAEAAFPID